jgi:very-short-patch-repair endonuclease/endogenous inhibitor of DNA gyrase (YacG/DUF329 family)
MPSRKYQTIFKKCPRCNKEFETFNGGQLAKQFCSRSCAMKSRKLSEENKRQISNSVTKWFQENNANPDYISKHDMPMRDCLQCGKSFIVYNKKLRFCSKICSNKHQKHSLETRDKMRESAIVRVEQGIHNGWRPRNEPSFPERMIASLLDKLGIELISEHPIKRWLIDFADLENKIALEIDGKQHDLPKRQASDLKKDQYLIDNGWRVFRIRWRKLTPEFYQFLENELLRIFRGIKT